MIKYICKGATDRRLALVISSYIITALSCKDNGRLFSCPVTLTDRVTETKACCAETDNGNEITDCKKHRQVLKSTKILDL